MREGGGGLLGLLTVYFIVANQMRAETYYLISLS